MRLSILLAALGLSCAVASAATCESLMSLALPDSVVTMAKTVPADGFTPPAPSFGDTPTTYKNMPALCRVSLTMRPSSDSDIKVEVWLPTSNWNGKYEAVGNGGWAGSINYNGLSGAIKRGYATSSTDTGHSTDGASFALGHPEKVLDYAYRSEHEMILKAKAVIAAYYGEAPKFSYWNSCSSGGKQALKEAQRFPQDFDGIVAGSPSLNWTGRAAQGVWIAQAVHKDAAGYIPPDKYSLLHNAVLAACDAQDGVKDGVLEDPTRCKFDPQVLQCKEADGPACLSAPQVEVARKIYSGAINPRTGQIIFPGHQPGSELGWAVMASPKPFNLSLEHFKYVVFQDPAWDYKTFNFDSDYDRALKVDNGTINAMDPNIKPFAEHGGKLIQYHGWNDPQISPGSSVNYYNSVVEATGAASKVQESYRLFMVPGMGHCSGGQGTDTFDALGAIEQWVEHGKAPQQIVASRIREGKLERTRPLCPYPQVAKYKGTGSTDEAANFSCQVP